MRFFTTFDPMTTTTSTKFKSWNPKNQIFPLSTSFTTDSGTGTSGSADSVKTQAYLNIVGSENRTTLTQDRRRILAWQRLVRLRDFHENGILPTAEARPRRVRRTGTSNFRRAIYFQRDLWVRPMSDITGRYRETTPEFFQLNPAMTHRLVPWLNRELNVLLTNHENRVSYVLDLILRMITQSHICSRAFREALQEYTGAQTEHFIHEFFQFARSPFDMHGFDENANYEPRNTISHEEVAVSESSDEDIIPQVPAHTTMSSSRAVSTSYYTHQFHRWSF